VGKPNSDRVPSFSKSLLASKDHVFLTWHDVSFSVPLKKKDMQKERLVEI